MARYVVGSVWRTRALHASNRGLDVVPAVDHAIAAYDEALKLDPVFVWALNESCSVYGLRGRREAMHGIDASRSIQEAVSRCRRAVEIDASFAYAKANGIIAQLTIVEQRVNTGQSPRDVVQTAERLIDVFRQQMPGAAVVHYWLAILGRLEATYQLDAGGDPAPALARLDASAQEHARIAPTSTVTGEVRGEAAAIRARFHLEKGEDPSPWVSEAREAFGVAIKAKPWDVGYRVRAASVETIALRWALRNGKAVEAQLDAALAPLLPVLDVERADPQLYQTLGEIRELGSAFRIQRGDDPKSEIDEGLAQIAHALSLHPHMASALACKGRLLLLRAKAATDRREAQEAARMALEAFSAAARENPLLERRERQSVDEARRLVKDDTPRPE
jgi:serine/threonine-protein kinase